MIFSCKLIFLSYCDAASIRYVRILGNAVHAIQIKTKLCQLVEVMMERRDDLSFCQEMKFRSVLRLLWLPESQIRTAQKKKGANAE